MFISSRFTSGVFSADVSSGVGVKSSRITVVGAAVGSNGVSPAGPSTNSGVGVAVTVAIASGASVSVVQETANNKNTVKISEFIW